MAHEEGGARGRPRGFDADAALEQAMLVFWEHGYEGASLASLTDAMGISTTSMYGAFGNKEELFRKALERYAAGPSSYLERALEEPTAHDVAAGILNGAIRTSTIPGGVRGCLGVQGALATGDAAEPVRDLLAGWRNDGCCRLRDRFQRAVDEGELSSAVDPAVLARYITTLIFGIAVQAAGGTERDELQAMADAALADWPPGRNDAGRRSPSLSGA